MKVCFKHNIHLPHSHIRFRPTSFKLHIGLKQARKSQPFCFPYNTLVSTNLENTYSPTYKCIFIAIKNTQKRKRATKPLQQRTTPRSPKQTNRTAYMIRIKKYIKRGRGGQFAIGRDLQSRSGRFRPRTKRSNC